FMDIHVIYFRSLLLSFLMYLFLIQLILFVFQFNLYFYFRLSHLFMGPIYLQDISFYLNQYKAGQVSWYLSFLSVDCYFLTYAFLCYILVKYLTKHNIVFYN